MRIFGYIFFWVLFTIIVFNAFAPYLQEWYLRHENEDDNDDVQG